MDGFRKLIDRLNDDGVTKDKRFGSEAVAVWWRKHFGENEGVSESIDHYCTNRLPVLTLPKELTAIRLERALPDDFDLAVAPFAISLHKTLLLSFAKMRDLLRFIESEKLGLDGYESISTEDFLRNGLGLAIDRRSARNHVQFLLRQGFDRFAVARGLKKYDLAGGRRFFWFPSNLVADEKVHFATPDGGKSWRAMVGYKSIKAREANVRIRNWHFGIEGID